MPDSPLAYFGNRSEALEDIFALIEIQREGKQYACFYDLFAGSGSLSLAAMKRGIAQRYVVNDIYKPLTEFWQAVRDTPEALITAYEKLVDTYLQKEYKERELFYQTIQAEFNVNQLKQADANAYFAFIINHAAQGMPKFAHDQLACTVTSDLSELEIDKDFSCRVKAVHELFKKHDVTFTALDFVNYLELVTAEDLAICNPPYPDMLDQEESPTEYIYQRTENKAQLQVQLSQLLQLFERNQVSFLLFYGVLGFKNHYPLVWPQGHILHLVENPKQPDFAYVEHLYVSYSLLPAVLSEQCPSTIQPNFYRLFEVHALKHDFFPEDRIALVAGEQRYTYEQINRAANRLARYLLAQGLEQALAQKSDQEPLVALYLDRCPQLFISILALMKCGVAYLPLETKHERLSAEAAYARIERSQASYVLTHPDLGKTLQQIAHNTIQTIEVSRDDFLCEQLMGSIEDDSNLHRAVSRTDLAYVVYTSGTTGGEPKGVEILQRGLIYAFESHQDLLNLGCEDRVAQFASIGFDASLMEMMMAWGAGAQLHLINDAQYSDIKLLMAFLQAHEITIAIQTPKMLAGLDANNFPHLRGLLIVGDCFPKTLSDAWLKEIVVHGRKQLRQVLNGYGLTETTICTTLDPCAVEKPLSIGHAILGLEIYLRPIEAEMDNKPLMENQWLTFSKSNTTTHNLNYEPHTSYALYVSGVGLARGYWQRPQLTHERFQTISLQGKTVRVYQTGDVGYLTTQGSFVVTGRIDRQVKIRGQRVELGEIEEQLKQHPAVEDVYVFAPRINTGERRLAAYIVPKDKQLLATLTGKIVLQAIHQALSKMPNYMIPALVHMAFCPVLPRKTNDKKNYDIAQIERWGLPIRRYSDDMISPYTEIELQLQAIWAKVLGYESEQLSLTDNFYELGGDSILVNQMLNEVQQTLLQEHESISVQDFHLNPTLQGLAQLLKRAKNALENFELVIVDLTNELPNTIRRDPSLHAFIKDSLSTQLKLLKPQLSQPVTLRVEVDTIFCVHSLSGDARQDLQNSQLRKLPVRLIYLNVDQPECLPKTIEAMAANYVAHIRKTQAQGPYWLLGWSLGGLIAFEMARQLEHQSEMVRVWLLDTEAPILTHALTKVTHIQKLVAAIDKLARLKATQLAQIPAGYYEIFQLDIFPDTLADDKTFQSQFVFQHIREKFIASRKLWPTETVTMVENLLTTTQILYEASLDCVANDLTVVKNYTLFVAEATKQAVNHLGLGWQVSSGCVKLIKDVNHFELLGHPNLQDTMMQQWDLQLSFIKELMAKQTANANYYIALGVLHTIQKQYELALLMFETAFKCDAKNFTAYRRRGNVYLELKQYDQALAEYEEALQINAKDALSYYCRGLVKCELNNWNEAIADFKQAIELNSDDKLFYESLGFAYFSLSKYDQAIAEYRKALSLDMNDATNFYNLGTIYAYLKQDDKALIILNNALKLDPANANIYRALGHSYGSLEQYNEALDVYKKALELNAKDPEANYGCGFCYGSLKQFEQALVHYDEALNLGLHDPGLYYYRGIAFAELKQYEQALSEYDQAIKLGFDYSDVYINRGIAFVRSKQYEKALAEYDEALKLEPSDPNIYYNRGNMYRILEQYEKALTEYDKALKLGMNDANLYYYRGIIFTELGRFEKALTEYDKALKLVPNRANIYYRRGYLLANFGLYKTALADLNKALELEPDDFDIICLKETVKKRFIEDIINLYDNVLMDFSKGLISRQQVITNLDQELTEYFDDFVLCKHLSYLYYQVNCIDKAIFCLKRFETIAPGDVSIYHNLASFYFIQGNILLAEEIFKKSIIFDSNAGILCEYGHFLCQQKCYLEAIYQLEQALEKDRRESSVLFNNRVGVKISYCLTDIEIIDYALRDMVAGVEPSQLVEIRVNVLAHYLLIKCFYHLEQYQKAVLHFSALAELSIVDPIAAKLLNAIASYTFNEKSKTSADFFDFFINFIKKSVCEPLLLTRVLSHSSLVFSHLSLNLSIVKVINRIIKEIHKANPLTLSQQNIIIRYGLNRETLEQPISTLLQKLGFEFISTGSTREIFKKSLILIEQANTFMNSNSFAENNCSVEAVREMPIAESSPAKLISQQSALFTKPDIPAVSVPTQEEIQLNWAIAFSQQDKISKNDDSNFIDTTISDLDFAEYDTFNSDSEQESTDDTASSDEEGIRPLLKK